MQTSEPQEISAAYRVVGERPHQQPIFAPGGLGRLTYLVFAILTAVALSYVVNGAIRLLAKTAGL